jgi:hypothetical protein
LVIVYAGTTYRLYVDKVAQTERTLTMAGTTTAMRLNSLASGGTPSNEFRGQQSMPLRFNRALNQAEIDEIYDAQLPVIQAA